MYSDTGHRPAGTARRSFARRTVRRFLAAPVALALLAPTGASAAQGNSCPQTFGSFSASNAPAACWRPYGPDSPFNKPIPAGARVATDSARIVGQMERYGYGFDGGKRSLQFSSFGSRPVYWSRPSNPVVTVRCTDHWGPHTCQGANGQVIDGIKIQIPAGAEPENAWDHHMIVIDQADDIEYDFERAFWTGPNQLTVWSGSEIPISADGGTGLGGGADAGDFGLLAGIILPSELTQGSINHAMSISVPCTAGYVWPSTGPWGLACGRIGQRAAGALHMGSLLQLNMSDAEIAATGAPAWQQTIMRAMAHYGMYVNDTNGGGGSQTLELEKQSDESFTSVGQAPQMRNAIRSLGGKSWSGGVWGIDGVPIDISKLRVIDPCVARGTCAG